MVKQLVRKIFQIKNLKLRIFILVTLVLGSLAIFQYEIQTKIIKEMFQPQLSSNPEATEHFMDAMGVASYIERLHNFVNYDNFLMKPLFYKMNKDYEKGKSLLPENSAEDVFWYMLLYRKIYGIGANISKNDNSLRYDKDFKTEEDYTKYYEDILNKITRLGTLDFEYDAPLIRDNKLRMMNMLLTEYLDLVNRFTYDYLIEKKSNLILEKKYLDDINSVYNLYKHYLINNDDKRLIDNKYFEIRILSYLLNIDKYQTLKVDCQNLKYKELFKNIREIENFRINLKIEYDKPLLSYIFNQTSWLKNLVKSLSNCDSLKEEVSQVLKILNKE
ncbi:hypothetical protein [Aliarcobacter cryaerophilus]|uniref:hypothetical protein n=1 Tax=Aliarcobacter cryaerophilus TaxID=28198 RepID=UPI0021B26717|nr:hypothetical protein [Aliarcobacter cryaerophilus]MCT7484900.1 hypothetical protein [Aliarcobacter cryaerophilus]